MKADIHKTGLIVVRDNRVLLCRKKGPWSPLILPGGKFEPGETELECLAREMREEMGVALAPAITKLGTYFGRTSEQFPRSLQIELYLGEITGEPSPQSEIGALVWFGPGDDEAELSPSLRESILPDLRRRALIA